MPSSGPNPAANQPEPDEAAIRRHVELLVAPAVGTPLGDGLIEIAYGHAEPSKAHLFALTDLHLAVEFAARVNKAGYQTYVGMALRKPGTHVGKRSRKTAFYGSHWAWLDDASDWQAAEAASSGCPPDIVVCTGQVPAWRGQYLWRFLEPITEGDRLEALNRGIQQRLGGEDVSNADRLMRLAGTVNWPIKPGRTVPELVTLRWFNGAASATDFDLASQVYANVPPRSTGQTATGARNVFGQIDLDKAIAEAAKPGRWHATVRDVVAHLVGRKTPDDIVHAICRNFTLAGWTHEQTRTDVDTLLAGARAKWGEETFDQVDESARVEPPLPLLRELPPATPFPIDALGTLLGDAARGIQDIIQAPLAMCGQSVLGAAALVAQSHADVELPIQQARPLSLFLLSIAATGDRKTACDEEALRPIRRHEYALAQTYDAQLPYWRNRLDVWKQAREKILKDRALEDDEKRVRLAALGPEPEPPLSPVILCGDPTIEGLIKLLATGQPSMGMFSAEGGQFVGGHGMSAEHRLKTAAAFSELWDARPIKRVRAGDDVLVLRGRRVSAHLMMQPNVSALLLADALLAEQGLLSRILIAAPESLVGTRFAHTPMPASDMAIKTYEDRLVAMLGTAPTLAPGKPNELQPREVELTKAAAREWFAFADAVERQMSPGGEYDTIRGLANKLAEHAARIAGVLVLVNDLQSKEIDQPDLEAGIELARYYAAEALRLHAAGMDDPDLLLAQRLLTWLQAWQGPVSLPDIYQRGPAPIRNAATAGRIVKILEEHQHLRREPNGAEIVGKWRQTVWTKVEP
jgi:hypothetical protein